MAQKHTQFDGCKRKRPAAPAKNYCVQDMDIHILAAKKVNPEHKKVEDEELNATTTRKTREQWDYLMDLWHGKMKKEIKKISNMVGKNWLNASEKETLEKPYKFL